MSCTGGCNVYTLYSIVDNRYEESITVLVLVSCIFTSSCSGHFFFLGGNQKKSVKGNKKKNQFGGMPGMCDDAVEIASLCVRGVGECQRRAPSHFLAHEEGRIGPSRH